MGRKFSIVVIVLLAVAALLAGAMEMRLVPDRYNPLAPIDLAEAPNVFTNAKLWLMAGDTPSCIAALQHAGVAVNPMPARTERPGCRRDSTVTISRLSRAELAPEEMNCAIALRLYLLERHGIQPLARRAFGTQVDRILHFGSYSCRTIRGSKRMSEHAIANAFDLAGFRLANRRTITLKQDWTAGGASAGFLRDVRVQACLLFNMVLSPDYNADHADHFHLDMGWFMGCH
jgi:hypothetical protein